MLVNYVQQQQHRIASTCLISLQRIESHKRLRYSYNNNSVRYSYSYSCSYSIGYGIGSVSIAGLCINKYAFIGRRLQLFAIKATFFLISISC